MEQLATRYDSIVGALQGGCTQTAIELIQVGRAASALLKYRSSSPAFSSRKVGSCFLLFSFRQCPSIMARLLTSVLLASTVLFDSVCQAGRFSELTHGRVARHEIKAEAEKFRKLESRGGNKGRYLSNATLRT
jgi:hypothetical protein